MIRLKELFANREAYEPVAEMERALLRRKEKGNLAGFIMVISAFLQVVFMVIELWNEQQWEGMAVWENWFSQPGQILIWVFMLGAILAYVGYNYTDIALKASKEPFKYTFWIGEFECLDNSENWDNANFGLKNFKELVRHDLMQMLHDRIQRFTLLENSGESEKAAFSKRDYSHIHISGHYSLQVGDKEKPQLKVVARIRIGPENRPASLIAPILFPLDLPSDLSSSGYQQLMERLFSGVASMIYSQIEEDISAKISLFPTSYLKATALCYEAEDFARSNTIDGYERAIGLYDQSLSFYQKMGVNLTVTSKISRFKWLALVHPKSRIQAWAKSVLGFAKYRIFRNQMASLSGQISNPLYDLPELLEKVREVLVNIYMNTNGIKVYSKRGFLKYAQGISKNTPEGNLGDSKNDLQKTLFETYVVLSLAHRFLGSLDRSEEMLSWAAATIPGILWKHPLYLLAKGLMQPDTHKSLVHFHHVVDLIPDFQMAQWFLAQELEKEFRRRDELDANRASTVIKAYEQVLHLNAGNIAAIGAIGHLYWLLSRDDETLKLAEEKLVMGTEVKSLNSETYIGDLNFRLARIAAERGEFHLCRERYLEAAGIDPSVGSFLPPSASRSFQSDYDHINLRMVQRFHGYLDRVNELVRLESLEKNKGFSEKTKNFAYAFALNDYGNACLRYFHFHGDEEYLLCAIHSYRKAGDLFPEMAVIWFNLQNALGWKGQWEEVGRCMEKARKFAPAWSLAAIQSSDEWFRTADGDLQAPLNMAYSRFLEMPQRDTAFTFPTYDKTKDSWCSDLGEFQDEFDRKFIIPLRKIYSYSKNAALYEDDPNYGNALIDLLRKIQKIPWQRIDVEDMQVLQELLKVITYANKPKLLSEALRLGEHLLSVVPQDHFLLSTQLNLLSKCIFYQFFLSLTESASSLQTFAGLKEPLFPFLRTWVESAIKDPMNQKFQLLEANISFIPHLISEFGEHNITFQFKERWKTILQTYMETKRGAQLLEYDNLLIQTFEMIEALVRELLRPPQDQLNAYFNLYRVYQTRMERLTEFWLHADNGGFLSIYWYFYTRGRFIPQKEIEIRESFFTLDHGKASISFGNLLKSLFVVNRQEKFLEQSIDHYRQAIKNEEDRYDARFNEQIAFFHLYLFQERWALARQSLQKAIEFKSDLEPILHEYASKLFVEIGLDYQKRGELGSALFYLEQAETYSSMDAYLHFKIYETAKESLPQNPGYEEKAIAALKKAMALDTAYDTAHWKAELQRLSLRTNADTINEKNQFAPLSVEFDLGLEKYFLNLLTRQLNDTLLRKLELSRSTFRNTWGFNFPPILFRYSVGGSQLDTGYLLVLHEIPEKYHLTNGDQKFIIYDKSKPLPEEFDQKKLAAIQMCGLHVILWIEQSDEGHFLKLGHQLYDALDHLLFQLDHFLSMHLLEIFSFQSLIDLCRLYSDGACGELVDDPVSIKRFYECCKGLLAEGLPLLEIEELAGVFMSQPRGQSLTKTIANLRKSPMLRQHINSLAEKGKGIGISGEIEKVLLEKINFAWQADHSNLCLPTKEYQDLTYPFNQEIGKLPSPFVIVQNEQIRPFLKSLLLLEHPDVHVFALSELSEPIPPSAKIDQIQ